MASLGVAASPLQSSELSVLDALRAPMAEFARRASAAITAPAKPECGVQVKTKTFGIERDGLPALRLQKTQREIIRKYKERFQIKFNIKLFLIF